MLLFTVFSLLALATGGLAWFDVNSKTNLVLYWGQNSAAKKTSQDRLITYCQNPDVDIIVMSFLIQFNGLGGEPVLNFANQGMAEKEDPVKCTLFPGSSLFECPELEADIQECQKIKSKTILLSLGGDSYTEGGFATPDLAISTANKLWAMFGPPQDHIYHPYAHPVLRPFGYASVDGFDFDFEGPNTNSAVFAQRLRQLMDEYRAAYGRQFFLSAAPQCPYPEVWMNEIMANVHLDMVFVQFYNNYCGVSQFVPGTETQTAYNFELWDQWARQTSKNKNVKVFMGVPGNTAAGRGYAPPSTLAPVIDHSMRFSQFGGTMIWDASQAYLNGDFIGDVKEKMREADGANGESQRSFLPNHRHMRAVGIGAGKVSS